MGRVSRGGLGMTSCFTVQGENRPWGWRWGAAGRRPRDKPGGPCGEGTVRARGSTSVCAPGRPPWGCSQLKLSGSPVGVLPVGPARPSASGSGPFRQPSSRPFAQGETRPGSGASQRLFSSRLVSRRHLPSHRPCMRILPCLPLRGRGGGAHIPS